MFHINSDNARFDNIAMPSGNGSGERIPSRCRIAPPFFRVHNCEARIVPRFAVPTMASLLAVHWDPRQEETMIEIFLIQLLATALGAVSTALADRAFDRARIGVRLHGLWVASSIAVICLPVIAWTSNVFLGSGSAGRATVAILVASIFFWVYCNLPKPSSMLKRGLQPSLPRPSGGAAPPASRVNG
jgi:hypothetical protein